ncbi:protein lifeguard 3-like isoform X2 [Homarus americanus]|uniref:protein lifeguard 3-like isoform X2 n=1 Tax=Homarus americanus TaxID=6706 RepID=UPI001C43BC34|nr:protein lifeguard 3-like isoform X2 [Homarus americanus]
MQWTRHPVDQVTNIYSTKLQMSAPYPVDPNKSSGGLAGWTMPNAPPPNTGYPTQPGYAAPPNYSSQPATAFPPYPPPPYSTQPGFAGQPGAYDDFPGNGDTSTDITQAQPVYDASGGGFPIQDGNRGDAVPKEEVLPDQFGGSFSDKAIRHAFIRKVYLILMVQLLITLCIVSLFTFHAGVRTFVQKHMWVYFVSYAVFLVTYLSLVCCSGIRRRWPGNFIVLGLFTLALSYMAGTIASTFDTKIVFMTVGITCVICFLITLFATQTKYDFTGCGIYLFVATMVMFLFGIIAIFTYNKILDTVYAGGIALLFSMYLVYDTQMVVGGRRHQISPEEHIYSVLTLYSDIVYIFMNLLSVFGSND